MIEKQASIRKHEKNLPVHVLSHIYEEYLCWQNCFGNHTLRTSILHILEMNTGTIFIYRTMNYPRLKSTVILLYLQGLNSFYEVILLW